MFLNYYFQFGSVAPLKIIGFLMVSDLVQSMANLFLYHYDIVDKNKSRRFNKM